MSKDKINMKKWVGPASIQKVKKKTIIASTRSKNRNKANGGGVACHCTIYLSGDSGEL